MSCSMYIMANNPRESVDIPVKNRYAVNTEMISDSKADNMIYLPANDMSFTGEVADHGEQYRLQS